VPGKPTLYLESTIPSYLTARPSRDLIVAAHQQITHEWWEGCRADYDVYVSEAVLLEIGAGDPEAAARRLAKVEGLPRLPLTQDVDALALKYQDGLGLPRDARVDIVHIACAVAHRMEYLLTWNCTHIAHGLVIRRLQTLNAKLSMPTPVIVTPEELLASLVG